MSKPPLPPRKRRLAPQTSARRPASGIAVAGKEFGQAVKEKGWKGAPKVAWHALLHGVDVEDVGELA